jgi:hypothetical protein
MGHFLQYLGIVWLLNLGKYAGVEGSMRKRIQSTSSSNTLLLLLLWVSIGSLFYGARVGGDGLRIPICYTMIWNSLSLIHSIGKDSCGSSGIPVFAAPGVLI